ncbi:hypothetical protein PG5_36750 [Pseudomonas sp. G5(2012)]|nr:hypothetical protein PG5_36750 [Pseudomonas sp. G5(2012)]
MPTLVLNPFPPMIADLPGAAQGGVSLRAGFIVIKELL